MLLKMTARESVNSRFKTSFSTPGKIKPNRYSKKLLDDFDLCVLRRTIYDFHVTESTVPKMPQIYNDDVGYED